MEMKVIHENNKKSLAMLIVLVSMQSCSVYHSKTVSIDDAINSYDKVKIKSPDDDVYKFEKITKVDGEIYGLAKKTSSTAKELNDQIIWKNSDEKNVRILLTDKNISAVYVKNKPASTIVSIAIPVATVGVVIGISALVVESSGLVSIDLN